MANEQMDNRTEKDPFYPLFCTSCKKEWYGESLVCDACKATEEKKNSGPRLVVADILEEDEIRAGEWRNHLILSVGAMFVSLLIGLYGARELMDVVCWLFLGGLVGLVSWWNYAIEGPHKQMMREFWRKQRRGLLKAFEVSWPEYREAKMIYLVEVEGATSEDAHSRLAGDRAGYRQAIIMAITPSDILAIAKSIKDDLAVAPVRAKIAEAIEWRKTKAQAAGIPLK